MHAPNDVGYLLHHVSGVLYRQSDRALQERLGIGLSQFRILLMLQQRPLMKQRDLANCLGQTEASISRQVKLLLQKGMLATKVDPNERRQHLATPTAKGIKMSEAAREVLAEYQAPVFACLNDKQQLQLREVLVAMHEYACASGKPMACDRPAGIETIYANQKPSDA